MLVAAPSPDRAPGSPAALPPGWTDHKAPDGTVYYYHAESGTSSWTLPVADQAGAVPAAHSTAVGTAGAGSAPVSVVNTSGKPVGVPLAKRARSLSVRG